MVECPEEGGLVLKGIRGSCHRVLALHAEVEVETKGRCGTLDAIKKGFYSLQLSGYDMEPYLHESENFKEQSLGERKQKAQ